MAQHGVEVAVGTEGPRGSHRPPCGDCLRLCIDDQESDAESLREMRAGVRLCAGVWQVVAAEDCPSSQMGSRSANSEQPCAVQRDCVGLLPFSSRRVGSARWPPCVPGARGRLHCVRQRPCSRVCRVLVAAEAGSVRKDGKTALAPAAVADARDAALVLAVRRRQASATQRPLLEGCRHRGTGQPASLRRSRRPERHRSSTSRRPRRAALVVTLCPYDKELQQPVESCPCDALDSPAPCCLEGPEERAGEHWRHRLAAPCRKWD